MVILGISPFFFLSILLQRKVECLNDPIVETTENRQGHESEFNQDLTPVPDFECRNETLSTLDYEIYPNSSSCVKKYDLFLNSTAIDQKNDTMVICKPSWVSAMDKLTVGFYFSLIIFIINVNIFLVCTLSYFTRNSDILLLLVCLVLLSCLLCIGVVLLYISIVSDFSDCINKITHMLVNFFQLSVFGWNSLLTNNYILKFLERRRIEITDSKNILKNVSGIMQLGFVVTIIFVLSFTMLLFAYFGEFNDKIVGSEFEMFEFFFVPPVTFFLIINFMLCSMSGTEFRNRSESAIVFLKDVKSFHYKYTLYYFFSNSMWFVGCVAYKLCIHINSWTPWNCLVIVRIITNIAIILQDHDS